MHGYPSLHALEPNSFLRPPDPIARVVEHLISMTQVVDVFEGGVPDVLFRKRHSFPECVRLFCIFVYSLDVLKSAIC